MKKESIFVKYPAWWLGLGLSVLLTVVVILLDFNGLYGQDAHEYHRYTREIICGISEDGAIGPFFWPLGYPWLGALLGMVLGSAASGLVALSILSQGLLVVATAGLIREIFPEVKREIAAIFAFLFVGLAPYLLRNSVLAMSDTTGTLFTVLAVLYCVKYFRAPSARHLALAALFAALACLVRYNSVVILVIPAIMAGWRLAQSRRWPDLAVPVLLLAGAAWVEIFLHTRPQDAFSTTALFDEFSLSNLFSNQFQSSQGLLQYSLPNILKALYPLFYPGFFFPGILFLGVAIFRKMWFQNPLLIWVGISAGLYLLFLALLPVQNDRLFIQVQPLLVILFFPAFRWVLGKVETKKVLLVGLALAIVIIQSGLGIYASRVVYRLNKTERVLVEMSNRFRGEKLYVFGVEGAMESYEVTPEVVSMWYEKQLNARKGEGVLFNFGAFSQQFADYMPMENWRFFEANFKLDTLETGPEGWVIYELR